MSKLLTNVHLYSFPCICLYIESNFELMSESSGISSVDRASPLPSPQPIHRDHAVADETGALVRTTLTRTPHFVCPQMVRAGSIGNTTATDMYMYISSLSTTAYLSCVWDCNLQSIKFVHHLAFFYLVSLEQI